MITKIERVGFEPTIRIKPYKDLADLRLKPLSHLSFLTQVKSPITLIETFKYPDPLVYRKQLARKRCQKLFSISTND